MPKRTPNNKRNAKKPKGANMQRMLSMERTMLSLLRRVPKGTQRRAASVAKGAVKRAVNGSSLHPVAKNFFNSLVSPLTSTHPAYLPGQDARASLKFRNRMRFMIDVESGSSALLVPGPSMSNQIASIGTVISVDNVWESTGSFQSGVGTYATQTFTKSPFSSDQISDGVNARVVSLTFNVKYVGAHLNRAGLIISYENPERCILDTEPNLSGTSALGSFMPDMINDPILARYVNVSQDPDTTFTFHPHMWKSGASAAEGGWNSSGVGYVDNALQQSAFSTLNDVNWGGIERLSIGNGFLIIDNNSNSTLPFQVEVTADYEYSGGAAVPFSTPSPSCPPDHVAHVNQAVRTAKRDHVQRAHDPLKNVALSALNKGFSFAASAAKDGAKDLFNEKGGSPATLAAGIAAMLL